MNLGSRVRGVRGLRRGDSKPGRRKQSRARSVAPRIVPQAAGERRGPGERRLSTGGWASRGPTWAKKTSTSGNESGIETCWW